MEQSSVIKVDLYLFTKASVTDCSDIRGRCIQNRFVKNNLIYHDRNGNGGCFFLNACFFFKKMQQIIRYGAKHYILSSFFILRLIHTKTPSFVVVIVIFSYNAMIIRQLWTFHLPRSDLNQFLMKSSLLCYIMQETLQK